MNNSQGSVLWFTGLSGAGKTTTATAVLQKLRERGRRVELLDGDELRTVICKGLGFSMEDRFENVRRIAYIANLLSRNGVDVLISAISPYRAMREYAKQQIPGCVEIFVHCPLHVCEMRDVKGLYAKARSGEIKNFTGISDPYEEPLQPAVTLDSAAASLEENVQAVLTYLDQKIHRFHHMPGKDAI
ncbi:adenylyl-sulfate kinase [Paenibacillus sacheonensis]|uniref:Adenylyl-sulfate kinase n=1 Tax=Paenibacillus sacheonensis TaxID=742054 RepID=A0A7X4YKT2_9BACL|nr:adenylyl-sulfate kinase [Paenibacillus sacheonensis]MBM7563227.1 adenylylsulfate kinase [Paenibacillus sacheonensis]NBC68212.1 adenylyl-sulfate kinase [Paenibacillus sacheonensis]